MKVSTVSDFSFSFRFRLSLSANGSGNSAERSEYLRANVTSDLQYVWDDAEVPLELQYEMAQHYKSLRVFTAVGETTGDVRTAIQNDFNLDPARNPRVRAKIAQVVFFWLHALYGI